jgi:drug/metabolite transporter (DMT)-like permease
LQASASLRRKLLPERGERLPLAVIGLLQVAGMLGFSAVGLQFITAGRGIVLGYTFQLWAIPLGIWLGGERFGRRKLLASMVGLGGLLLFFNPRLVDWSDGRALLGNGLVLVAAACWAAGACLFRRQVWRSDTWVQTGWQMLASVPPLALLAVLADFDAPMRWSWGLTAIFAFNWVVPTALGYWWWGRVLAAMPAATAGQILMLTPVFGYLLSAAIEGAPLTPDVAASIALIVAGLVLALRGDAPARKPST